MRTLSGYKAVWFHPPTNLRRGTGPGDRLSTPWMARRSNQTLGSFPYPLRPPPLIFSRQGQLTDPHLSVSVKLFLFSSVPSSSFLLLLMSGQRPNPGPTRTQSSGPVCQTRFSTRQTAVEPVGSGCTGGAVRVWEESKTSIVQSFSLRLMNFVGNEMFVRIRCSRKNNNSA